MKRKNEIKIRLNDEELARLNGLAEKAAFSREEFLRKMIGGFELCEAPDLDAQKLIVEVAHLGTAFNLFTTQAEQGGQIDMAEYRRAADGVRETCRVIRSAYLPKNERSGHDGD